MSFLVLIYLSLVTVFETAAVSEKNETITCSFRASRLCFNMIQALGGNMNSTFDEKASDMNKTCLLNVVNGQFPSCLALVPGKCEVQEQNLPQIKSIQDFVGRLCTNGTGEQKDFLNASKDCFNKYEAQRKKCVKEHATNETTAKALCCQSFRTQSCVSNSLRKTCSGNSVAFQDRLIKTYSSYTNFMCKSYEKICNGAAVNFLSIASLLLTAKLIFINIFNI